MHDHRAVGRTLDMYNEYHAAVLGAFHGYDNRICRVHIHSRAWACVDGNRRRSHIDLHSQNHPSLLNIAGTQTFQRVLEGRKIMDHPAHLELFSDPPLLCSFRSAQRSD